MKKYFAYIRVSTMRQGEHGVSLHEQKSEIERYARQRDLAISEWFEERETAAKLGRAIFNQMIGRLRNGEADGVIIHKIDRSARNLRDWVEILQLTDDGIEVHFTREAVDLQSSSGRLSADVQAVVAANYVRNLREEIVKGFYGRLKQGFYPMPAPLGYEDAGAGKPKTIDPIRGPLIQAAFQLYASSNFSLYSLAEELKRRGLRTKSGLPVSKTTLARILSNPFYIGLIRIRKGNKTFVGAHMPLATRTLFDAVQDVLHGRAVRTKPGRREFLFSRIIECRGCSRSLVGEVQKGHTYYRCHSSPCRGTSFREEEVHSAVSDIFRRLQLRPEELEELDLYMEEQRASSVDEHRTRIAELDVRLAAIKDRLTRLMDALLDGHIESDLFEHRKSALLSERVELEGRIRDLRADPSLSAKQLQEYVELAKTAYLVFENGNHHQKRELIRLAMSNRSATGKTLDFSLKPALSALACDNAEPSGAPLTSTSRTQRAIQPLLREKSFWKEWIQTLEDAEAA
jgi:site-specific DNA recombinase